MLFDDIGVDKIGVYGVSPPGAALPCTPNLDALAAEGLLFERAWASPVCSPTRALILTGRHAFRTGIGTILDHDGDQSGLSAALEVTLPEILPGYDNAYVGKWHLAHATRDGLRHPVECGFRSFEGSLFNIAAPPLPCGPDCKPPDCAASGMLGYFNWVKTVASAAEPRATQTCVTTYATTVTADDAIARASKLRAPWFMQVSFNAAHLPIEKPPAALAPAGESCARRYREATTREELFDATVTALDTELGRMLAAIRRIDPELIVLVMGDNGTSIAAAQGQAESCFARLRSKGSLYEGGVRVPLIAAGPRVPRGRCSELVSAVDLFATVAELAGSPHETPDSVSFAPYLAGDFTPRRTSIYTETFKPNQISPGVAGQPAFAPEAHSRALRNARFKLIRETKRGAAPEEHFFDLQADPCEEHDLLAGLEALEDVGGLEEEPRVTLEALRAEMAAMGVYE